MPSCAAIGCVRQSDVLIKRFPRKDRRRRQIWIERVNRPGWLPPRSAVLCERHFDKDQWQLQEDGKRKLKNSALPTIFPVNIGNDCGVLRDHPYCNPFYRKIFDDGKIETDQAENEETVPIEHVKVETDENENFTPEIMGEDQEGRGDSGVYFEEIEDEEGVFESIQCTPDISVFPESGEPFPIEMVNCEVDDVNTCLAEPENDPLAISAEDKITTAKVPYFGNSQKLLFIPKTTKKYMKLPCEADGEPKVLSFVSKYVSISTETNDQSKATLKVKSLDRLLDPNMAINAPSSTTILPPVNSKTMLRSPSAVYLKEPLTLEKNSAEPEEKIKKWSNPPRFIEKIEFDQDVVTLTKPKLNISEKVKVIPTLLPKLNVVANQISAKQDLNFLLNQQNMNVQKVPVVVLPSRKNIVVRKRDTSRTMFSSGSKEEILKPGLYKCGDTSTILDNKRFEVIKQINKINSQYSQETCQHLDKVDSNPHYIAESTKNNVTVDSNKKEDNGKITRIGNNDVKLWLDSNLVQDKYECAKLIHNALVQKNRATKRSPVIVLKPYGSQQNIQSSGIVTERTNILNTTVYHCKCRAIFSTERGLNLHQRKCGILKKLLQGNTVEEENDDKDVVIVESSSESSDDSENSEQEDSESSQFSNWETAELILSPFEDSSSNENYSETDTATEEEVNKVNLSKKLNLNTLNYSPLLENNLPKAPDLSSVQFKSYESLKKSGSWGPKIARSLTNRRKLTENKLQESVYEKNKCKAFSIFTNREKSSDGNNLEDAEDQLLCRVKLRSECLIPKSSQNLSVTIPKLHQSKIGQNKEAEVKQDITEKELVVISSSSSTCSIPSSDSSEESNSSSGSNKTLNSRNSAIDFHSKVDSDGKSKDKLQKIYEKYSEISFEKDVSMNTMNSLASPPKAIGIKKINELIAHKKNTVLNGNQSKELISNKKVELFEPLKNNDFSRIPIVLLPRLNPRDITNLDGNSSKIHSSESDLEIQVLEHTVYKQKITLKSSEQMSKISERTKKKPRVKKNCKVKIPVDVNITEEVVDLTQTDETIMERKCPGKTPLTLLSKQNIRGVKRKCSEDTNCKTGKRSKHSKKGMEEDVVMLGVDSENDNYSQEYSSVKSITEDSSSNQGSISVPSKSKLKRNLSRQSFYKKYKESMKKPHRTSVINITQR